MTKLLASGRDAKLNALFKSIIHGKRPIRLASDASLFFEAVLFMAELSSPSSVIEILLSSKSGLDALYAAVRASFKLDFLIASTLPFIRLLSDPNIKSLGDGIFLDKILGSLLKPSSVWNAILQTHLDTKLDGHDLVAFAWLCLEVVSSELPDLEQQQSDVRNIMTGPSLLDSPSHDVRTLAYRIQKMVQTRFSTGSVRQEYGPGGRHDNDFADFRDINIFPTNDELLSKERPYLQRLDDVFATESEQTSKVKGDENRTATYLGWMYRLLREDMVCELREDLQAAMRITKGRRPPLTLWALHLEQNGNHGGRSKPYTITLRCDNGLEYLANATQAKRVQILDNPNSPFKHGALGALCLGQDIIAFGSMIKDKKAMLNGKTVFGLQLTDAQSLEKALTVLCGSSRKDLVFYVVNTPTFAYEPILKRLKELKELPLDHQLLERSTQDETLERSDKMKAVVKKLTEIYETNGKVKLDRLVETGKSLQVGGPQLESLINGLKSPLAQIQGPPGTGKSFIGALIILMILKVMPESRVLVLSFKNHAIDQFIGDLVDIGVESSGIVRLGSKASPETETFRMDSRLKDTKFRPPQSIWNEIQGLKKQVEDSKRSMTSLLDILRKDHVSAEDILDLLEFSDDGKYWAAFQVPDHDDGFQVILSDNKAATSTGLYEHWRRGDKIPALASALDPQSRTIWSLPKAERVKLSAKWEQEVRQEYISDFVALSETLGDCQSKVDRLFDESKRNLLKKMRVIACTTTGAAMFQSIIKTAAPDVIIVEEAGEILEAHIVAALSPSVKQLILIGDHKQLRPKVNNYSLTVEKGDGYDLNVSMFERLIRQGHRYTVLQEQHRSHPMISHYARLLAYEKLEDSPKTLNREPIRGLESRVVFMHHEHAEEEMPNVADRGDAGTNRSKRNAFEALMVIKTVKYLGQQGYSTENMVVLTPYLGQLSLLKDLLSKINDPVLNDLDSHELLRAGLLSNASTNVKKGRLRLSTIDNYQGEESDIVIASLARSNANGDIGFLYAQARLVVLMSRARNGIILFGNMHTFLKSKKGHELWSQYFDALKTKGCLFDGIPVRCEQHPTRTFLLKKPQDFEQHCPDGGCAETCGASLSCGKHACKRRCHRHQDHSKAPCDQSDDRTCERGHKYKVPCGKTGYGCKSCAKQDEEIRRRGQRDLDLEAERQERQSRYAQDLQELDDEIDHERRRMKDIMEMEQQAKTLREKKDHLRNLRATKARVEAAEAQRAKAATQPKTPAQKAAGNKAKATVNDASQPASGAREEWEAAKANGESGNDALDKLMDLIGLESVKDEFLSIKSSIDVKVRQGMSLSEERFSCSLLGNPGTGKTTVARLWGQFLMSTGAIPGNVFKETTGSKLASQGVPGCEKMIEDIKNDGGGVLFVDEAYQLSSGNNPGGKAVLDYLLAEVENLRGKIVFVLAGYDKEMESFFSHNPGLPSRFPITLTFGDYSDNELLQILERRIHGKCPEMMQIEGGSHGLYARIVARRLGRGRGKAGFGNARAVENALGRILKNQANRIRQAKRVKVSYDELILTKVDLIGPEPSEALSQCPAWTKLNELIGLDKVKEELTAFRDTVITNYERELAEEPVIHYSLNRVFLGPPGTGKTTVAKLYGQILSHLGLLSNGEVVVKNPSDFVGSALGQSESQTKGILAATVGKVLVIDEAYGLYAGSGVTDPYKTAVVDTIVAEVHSVPGDDRCVLLLGYDEQMQEMFQNVNPGLTRRFPMSSAFVFEDFDDAALSRIFDLKLKLSAFKVSGEAKGAAMDVLRRARNRPNFGNAGEVDILLDRAKANQQKRASKGPAKRGILEAVDFDEDFDRATRATDVKALFKGDVGRDAVIALLEDCQTRVRELKSLDMDPNEEIPFSFLFRGPPGTGKTTTARKMGKVYYDMGFLAKAEVVECSASDMIGQYVGQTGPKVQALMEKALGKVLFIDEAYRLAGGLFAQEAVDELVDCVTKPKYQGKMIIILAGYVEDINRLLKVNPGMTSRFPEVIDFEPLTPNDCLTLLCQDLRLKQRQVEAKGKTLDLTCLESPSADFKKRIIGLFQQMSALVGWASGRDVKQIAKMLFRSVKLSEVTPFLSDEAVLAEMLKFLTERSSRDNDSKTNSTPTPTQQVLPQNHHAPPPHQTRFTTETRTEQPLLVDENPEEAQDEVSEDFQGGHKYRATRDTGVTDEIWEQLEKDKITEAKREQDYQKLEAKYKAASEKARQTIIKQLLEERRQREEEMKKKEKLKAMGRCPVGFAWIKQESGWRCAGGSHWMSDREVDSM